MKRKKITYGVHGMMEYQSIVKVGKALMKVPFSEGSVSAMGTTPAVFTTDNPVVQMAIENSADFKRGLIKKVQELTLEGEVRVLRNQKHSQVSPSEGECASPTTGSREADAEGSAQTAPGDMESPQQEDTSAKSERMEFACNDDAREYLERNFGVLRSKMRVRQDIIAAGLANGIEIVFA